VRKVRERLDIESADLHSPNLHFPDMDWELSPWHPVTPAHHWAGLRTGTLLERLPIGGGTQLDYQPLNFEDAGDWQRIPRKPAKTGSGGLIAPKALSRPLRLPWACWRWSPAVNRQSPGPGPLQDEPV
jgi:hypothetical protein